MAHRAGVGAFFQALRFVGTGDHDDRYGAETRVRHYFGEYLQTVHAGHQQVQQAQESMQKAQAELARLEVTGESGGGMVKVVMSGTHDVRRVSIDTATLGDDREMLEDLVAAAINDAVRRVEEESKSRLAGLAAGLDLPAGMKLPF